MTPPSPPADAHAAPVVPGLLDRAVRVGVTALLNDPSLAVDPRVSPPARAGAAALEIARAIREGLGAHHHGKDSQP